MPVSHSTRNNISTNRNGRNKVSSRDKTVMGIYTQVPPFCSPQKVHRVSIDSIHHNASAMSTMSHLSDDFLTKSTEHLNNRSVDDLTYKVYTSPSLGGLGGKRKSGLSSSGLGVLNNSPSKLRHYSERSGPKESNASKFDRMFKNDICEDFDNSKFEPNESSYSVNFHVDKKNRSVSQPNPATDLASHLNTLDSKLDGLSNSVNYTNNATHDSHRNSANDNHRKSKDSSLNPYGKKSRLNTFSSMTDVFAEYRSRSFMQSQIEKTVAGYKAPRPNTTPAKQRGSSKSHKTSLLEASLLQDHEGRSSKREASLSSERNLASCPRRLTADLLIREDPASDVGVGVDGNIIPNNPAGYPGIPSPGREHGSPATLGPYATNHSRLRYDENGRLIDNRSGLSYRESEVKRVPGNAPISQDTDNIILKTKSDNEPNMSDPAEVRKEGKPNEPIPVGSVPPDTRPNTVSGVQGAQGGFSSFRKTTFNPAVVTRRSKGIPVDAPTIVPKSQAQNSGAPYVPEAPQSIAESLRAKARKARERHIASIERLHQGNSSVERRVDIERRNQAEYVENLNNHLRTKSFITDDPSDPNLFGDEFPRPATTGFLNRKRPKQRPLLKRHVRGKLRETGEQLVGNSELASTSRETASSKNMSENAGTLGGVGTSGSTLFNTEITNATKTLNSSINTGETPSGSKSGTASSNKGADRGRKKKKSAGPASALTVAVDEINASVAMAGRIAKEILENDTLNVATQEIFGDIKHVERDLADYKKYGLNGSRKVIGERKVNFNSSNNQFISPEKHSNFHATQMGAEAWHEPKKKESKDGENQTFGPENPSRGEKKEIDIEDEKLIKFFERKRKRFYQKMIEKQDEAVSYRDFIKNDPKVEKLLQSKGLLGDKSKSMQFKSSERPHTTDAKPRQTSFRFYWHGESEKVPKPTPINVSQYRRVQTAGNMSSSSSSSSAAGDDESAQQASRPKRASRTSDPRGFNSFSPNKPPWQDSTSANSSIYRSPKGGNMSMMNSLNFFKDKLRTLHSPEQVSKVQQSLREKIKKDEEMKREIHGDDPLGSPSNNNSTFNTSTMSQQGAHQSSQLHSSRLKGAKASGGNFGNFSTKKKVPVKRSASASPKKPRQNISQWDINALRTKQELLREAQNRELWGDGEAALPPRPGQSKDSTVDHNLSRESAHPPRIISQSPSRPVARETRVPGISPPRYIPTKDEQRRDDPRDLVPPNLNNQGRKEERANLEEENFPGPMEPPPILHPREFVGSGGASQIYSRKPGTAPTLKKGNSLYVDLSHTDEEDGFGSTTVGNDSTDETMKTYMSSSSSSNNVSKESTPRRGVLSNNASKESLASSPPNVYGDYSVATGRGFTEKDLARSKKLFPDEKQNRYDKERTSTAPSMVNSKSQPLMMGSTLYGLNAETEPTVRSVVSDMANSTVPNNNGGVYFKSGSMSTKQNQNPLSNTTNYTLYNNGDNVSANMNVIMNAKAAISKAAVAPKFTTLGAKAAAPNVSDGVKATINATIGAGGVNQFENNMYQFSSMVTQKGSHNLFGPHNMPPIQQMNPLHIRRPQTTPTFSSYDMAGRIRRKQAPSPIVEEDESMLATDDEGVLKKSPAKVPKLFMPPKAGQSPPKPGQLRSPQKSSHPPEAYPTFSGQPIFQDSKLINSGNKPKLNLLAATQPVFAAEKPKAEVPETNASTTEALLQAQTQQARELSQEGERPTDPRMARLGFDKDRKLNKRLSFVDDCAPPLHKQSGSILLSESVGEFGSSFSRTLPTSFSQEVNSKPNNSARANTAGDSSNTAGNKTMSPQRRAGHANCPGSSGNPVGTPPTNMSTRPSTSPAPQSGIPLHSGMPPHSSLFGDMGRSVRDGGSMINFNPTKFSIDDHLRTPPHQAKLEAAQVQAQAAAQAKLDAHAAAMAAHTERIRQQEAERHADWLRASKKFREEKTEGKSDDPQNQKKHSRSIGPNKTANTSTDADVSSKMSGAVPATSSTPKNSDSGFKGATDTHTGARGKATKLPTEVTVGENYTRTFYSQYPATLAGHSDEPPVPPCVQARMGAGAPPKTAPAGAKRQNEFYEKPEKHARFQSPDGRKSTKGGVDFGSSKATGEKGGEKGGADGGKNANGDASTSKKGKSAQGNGKKSASVGKKFQPGPSLISSQEVIENEIKREVAAIKRNKCPKDRRKLVLQLLAKWHPDKNPENSTFATKIFQFIQTEL